MQSLLEYAARYLFLSDNAHYDMNRHMKNMVYDYPPTWMLILTCTLYDRVFLFHLITKTKQVIK